MVDPGGEVILYRSDDGQAVVQLRAVGGTVWLTQAQLAALYGTSKQNIQQVIARILADGEVGESTVNSELMVHAEGRRQVRREVKTYNLDMVLAVGYRVTTPRAVQFRQWATTVLKEYLIKGFALQDERLKDPSSDYFDELLERIRDIRASERRFYQKVRDLFVATSADYDPKVTAVAVPGLPPSVYDTLRGPGSYDRAATVGWARQNWDNPAGDIPGGSNCTNFASQALHHGGLVEGGDWWTLDPTGFRIPTRDGYHLAGGRAWASADDFYRFMTSSGAQEVTPSQAQPGDVVTWANDKEVHHVAVVSSVVDGDVRYTQHTGNHLDSSLGEREGYVENWYAEAEQWHDSTVRILRINQGWTMLGAPIPK